MGVTKSLRQSSWPSSPNTTGARAATGSSGLYWLLVKQVMASAAVLALFTLSGQGELELYRCTEAVRLLLGSVGRLASQPRMSLEYCSPPSMIGWVVAPAWRTAVTICCMPSVTNSLAAC